jgi:serine protease Do
MFRARLCIATVLASGITPSQAAATYDLAQYVVAVYGNQHFGSGVAISENRVATSCHTLQGANRVGVANRDMTIQLIAVRGMARPGKDVCLLHFDRAHGLPVPPLGSAATLQVGAVVTAVGFSNGRLASASGAILDKTERGGGVEVINSDTPVERGASGGGLFDSEGRLVGVVTYVVNDQKGRRVGNYSVPVEWVKELNALYPRDVWTLYQGGEFWRAQH